LLKPFDEDEVRTALERLRDPRETYP